jgi:hypothetical protein
MPKKIQFLLIILLFLFSSGCVQNSPSQVHQFTNPVEENISKVLITSNSIQDVWIALNDSKIPEKIGYRPSPSGDNAWIVAEIDPENNTWIAINVQQSEIIQQGENKSYFSGIFFDSYEDYQKELDKKSWTPSTFSPIQTTNTIVTTIPTSPPLPQNYNTEIDVNEIFWEALIGFIISFISISLFGFDAPELLGGLVFLIGLMGAVFTLISNPSTNISTETINLTNFIVPWIIECVKISLGAAFGAVFGAIVNAALNPSGRGR